MYIQPKNKLWTVVLCHLHSCVLSLICFYQIHLLLCINHLFWRVNQMTENCRRFTFHVSRFTFHVSYRIWDIFGILWGLPVKLKVSLVGRCASCVGMKVRSKLTLHRVTRHLFSHTLFWINILSSPVLFRSTSFVFRLSFFVFRQRRRRRTLILHLSIFVRCW